MRKIYSQILFALFLMSMASCENDFRFEPGTRSELRSGMRGPILTARPLQDLLFDLNADNRMDYLFHYTGWTTRTIPPSYGFVIYVESLDSNQVQNSQLLGTLALIDGTPISDTSGWNRSSGTLAWSSNGSPWSGTFVTSSPRNLGLRLAQHGVYYYGWVKLCIADDGTLSIFDYAVKGTGNSPIPAGYRN